MKIKLHNFIRDDLSPVKNDTMRDAIATGKQSLIDYLNAHPKEKDRKASICWNHINKKVIREEIYNKQNNQCCYCGEKIQDISAAQLDHIKPKNNLTFKPNDPKLQDHIDELISAENLAVSCPACNCHKSSKKDFINPYISEITNGKETMQDYFIGLYHDEDEGIRLPIIISNKQYDDKDDKHIKAANNHIDSFKLNSCNKVAYRMRMLLCNLYISEYDKEEDNV